MFFQALRKKYRLADLFENSIFKKFNIFLHLQQRTFTFELFQILSPLTDTMA
jgi:hypothetical protein